MKNLFITGIILFAASFIFAQNSAPETQPVGPQSHIEFTSIVHDFGHIVVNSDATCEFRFKNTGTVPLILSDVKASCGCTVPEWPRDPILPGREGVIKVRYTTVTRPNVINKSVIVYSNADNKQVVLRIKGEVIPES